MVAWSTSAFFVPLISTALIQFFDISAFMWVGGAISSLYGMFVIWRIFQREPVEEEEREPFQATSAQVPYYSEILPPEDESDHFSGASEGLA